MLKYTSKNTEGIYITPAKVNVVSRELIILDDDNKKSSPINSENGCLCFDGTYSVDCCNGKTPNQGIGKIQGVKIKLGSFSFGFSDGFEIK